MDASTITWYRFMFAATFVFSVLAMQRGLPKLNRIPSKSVGILLLAATALIVNYVANVEGLEYVNPETVQVVMQIAPFLLMVGGIVFYKERFNAIEILGACLLISGLALFFNQRLDLLFSELNSFSTGIFLIVFAAVAWAGYALLQKVLLRVLTAKQLTLLLYCIGIMVLLPFTSLNSLLQMNTLQLLALLFCCVNTIIAYGAFTEALNVWNASKVSAVIATAPVFTFISMLVAERLLPEFFQLSDLDGFSYMGAACVVFGSILTALAKQKNTLPPVKP